MCQSDEREFTEGYRISPMPLHSCGWLLTALLFATPFSNQAQKRPDFSGTWVAISPGDEGVEQTVSQTTKTLEVRPGSQGEQKGRRVVYNLDGSESRNQQDLQGHLIVTFSRASWKGEQLSITSSTTFPDGSKSESVETWSLDAKGLLVIEGAERMTGADGKPDGTGKLHVVFRRKP